MKRSLACAAAVGLLAAPGLVSAQDFSVSAGVSFTTDYIANGVTNSDRDPAIQPYVEIEASGFYAGLWASNVKGFGEDYEIDLYAGYRNEVGAFSYDFGYARYFYDRSGDCCGEFILTMSVDTGVGMNLGTTLKYDPAGAGTYNASLKAAYDINDMFSVSAEAGKVQRAQSYWNAGVGIALNDTTSIDLRVHDTDITKPRAVATLSFDFSLR